MADEKDILLKFVAKNVDFERADLPKVNRSGCCCQSKCYYLFWYLIVFFHEVAEFMCRCKVDEVCQGVLYVLGVLRDYLRNRQIEAQV